jgi:secreted trypsin-like serine protease
MRLQATVIVTLIVLTAVPAAAIIGGNPTSANDYPYFVKIHVFKSADPTVATQCGGSVIDAEWILTAAHCMDGERDEISVKVFMHDSLPVDAVELIMHPLWSGDAEDGHDLALLRVPSHATDGTGGIPEAMKVQVGAPGDPGAYAPGVIATVVGHGFTQAEGFLTSLHDLHTPLRSDADMDAIYDHWYWFSNWKSALMIGAGWTNHTVCNGDSGGPLTVDVNGVTVQVGVVSFGPSDLSGDETCDQPGAYAELSGPQLAWIAATLPGVATRWGTCWINTGRLGLQTPGRWVATYVDTGSDASGPDKDDTYRWKISCVPLQPVRKAPIGSGTLEPVFQ